MNKKALAVAISSALAVPMAAQAVSYNLSGQVNRVIMFADDGVASDIFFADNTASNTRFRLTGSEDMGNGMTAGFNLEWASSVNSNRQGPVKNVPSDHSPPAASHSVLDAVVLKWIVHFRY